MISSLALARGGANGWEAGGNAVFRSFFLIHPLLPSIRPALGIVFAMLKRARQVLGIV